MGDVALPRFLRFKDLVDAGIVNNRPTLHRWIRDRGFPKAVKLGPGTAAWKDDEVQAWLSQRAPSTVEQVVQTTPTPTATAPEATPQTPEAAELEKLKRKVAELRRERDEARGTIKAMSAKTPGLLSGLEILARSVPVSSLPMCGLYFLISAYEIVYIGQSATDILQRIRQHRLDPNKKFSSVFILQCSPADLDQLERRYIERFRPAYNTTHVPRPLPELSEDYDLADQARDREFLEKSEAARAMLSQPKRSAKGHSPIRGIDTF